MSIENESNPEEEREQVLVALKDCQDVFEQKMLNTHDARGADNAAGLFDQYDKAIKDFQEGNLIKARQLLEKNLSQAQFMLQFPPQTRGEALDKEKYKQEIQTEINKWQRLIEFLG